MDRAISEAVDALVAGKASERGVLNTLTESVDIKTGMEVYVAHGMYAGFSGKVTKELEGGYFEVKVENSTYGKVPVPGFALRPIDTKNGK